VAKIAVNSIIVTIFPAIFLIILFGGGELFRRNKIDMGGDPPIDKRPFALSKYLIIVIWAVMVLRSWDFALFPVKVPLFLQPMALFLWVSGFSLLYIGRFGLGSSFRIGSPQESTALKTTGLFKFSRNPMYVGVYATILASILYTMDPIALLTGIFVVAVHHKIVVAEEHYLLNVFGQDYRNYCLRVRRYL
jgi:protein-S-isoprenylcysteine O-methyltransferase Ste14